MTTTCVDTSATSRAVGAALPKQNAMDGPRQATPQAVAILVFLMMLLAHDLAGLGFALAKTTLLMALAAYGVALSLRDWRSLRDRPLDAAAGLSCVAAFVVTVLGCPGDPLVQGLAVLMYAVGLRLLNRQQSAGDARIHWAIWAYVALASELYLLCDRRMGIGWLLMDQASVWLSSLVTPGFVMAATASYLKITVHACLLALVVSAGSIRLRWPRMAMYIAGAFGLNALLLAACRWVPASAWQIDLAHPKSTTSTSPRTCRCGRFSRCSTWGWYTVSRWW